MSEHDAIMAELTAERFRATGWWTRKPAPADGISREEPDDDLATARRRRVLNEGMREVS